jgi:hypothetical protein
LSIGDGLTFFDCFLWFDYEADVFVWVEFNEDELLSPLTFVLSPWVAVS